MQTFMLQVKPLDKEAQKKIAGGEGGNMHCETLQGSTGIGKTDYRCDLDLPICEAI